MQNLKKVRMMTQLAIYDKEDGERDRKITAHYRHGYVYFKNLSMRIGVVLGCFMVEGIYAIYKMLFDEGKFMNMLTKQYIIGEGIKILIVLVIYSIICTFKYRKEYDEADERMDIYEQCLDKLYEDSQKKGM